MSIAEGNESTSMQELIGQQLSSHSEGLVKEWQTLQTKELKNKSRSYYFGCVEKAPLIQKASKY